MNRFSFTILVALGVAGPLVAQDAPPPEGQSDQPAQQQQRVDGDYLQQQAAAPAPEAQLREARLQLDAILAQNGLLTDAQRQDLAARLEQIAVTSNNLALQGPADQRLAAQEVELRAQYALAQRAKAVNEEKEAGYRVGKLRAGAVNARNLDVEGAEPLGDFWMMQADLFDINNAAIDLDARQKETIRRLEAFVEEHAAPLPAASANRKGQDDQLDSSKAPLEGKAAPKAEANKSSDLKQQAQQVQPAERSITLDVQLALLRLYDQRGLSDKACALIADLKQAAEAQGDEALLAELDRWYGYCPAIGRQFAGRLPTADGQVWASTEQRGKVVLIHFFADWFEPSIEAFDALRQAHATHGERGLTILSVDMGQAKAMPQVDWPIAQGDTARQTLTDLFAVRSLPRYVLLDREGKVVSVAGSLAILEQAQRLLDEAETP